MSLDSISAVDADLSRVSAASAQLAAALSQDNASPTATPDQIESGHAAVETAQANLAQAQAALQADESGSTTPTATTAPVVSQSVIDPGGILV